MQPTVESWSSHPTELGPLYPLVGFEFPMFLACVFFFLGFLVWKVRSESRHYDQLVTQLQSGQAAAGNDEDSPVHSSASQEPIDGQP